MDLLTVVAGLLRSLTLLAGLLLGGIAGAQWLLQRQGASPALIEGAGCRLARPLLSVLVATVLPLAVVETLWQTTASQHLEQLPELLLYMVTHSLFGVVWTIQVGVLGLLSWGLRRGHAPGLLGSAALLTAWPQIGHLAPPYQFLDGGATLVEFGGLAAHRLGAALWFGTLAVLLVWSRPGGPVDRPWGPAFVRFALPGAAMLGSGAINLLVNHGGTRAVFSSTTFATLVQLKIGLLLALVALGALHFWRYRQGAGPTTSRLLALEVMGALGAATLGAVLGVLPGPDG